MKEIVYLLGADIDIQAAYEFYEDFQEGRGTLFMRQLNLAFGQVSRFPESGPTVNQTYRRLLVPGFPYAIFYSSTARGIIVAAIMDIRQSPETIQRRLR